MSAVTPLKDRRPVHPKTIDSKYLSKQLFAFGYGMVMVFDINQKAANQCKT